MPATVPRKPPHVVRGLCQVARVIATVLIGSALLGLARGEVRLDLAISADALAFGPLDRPDEVVAVRGHELRRTTAEDDAVVLTLADGAHLRSRLRTPTRAAARIARTLRP